MADEPAFTATRPAPSAPDDGDQLVLTVWPDFEDADSPEAWADKWLFLHANSRHFRVDFPPDFDPDAGSHEGFPVEAYIHSGIMLALAGEGNFPDRRWDVAVVGAVYVDTHEFPTHEARRAAAENLIATWNQYLSGDVWFYSINLESKCPHCKAVDSASLDELGGIYGLEEAKTQGLIALDYYAKGGKP